MAASLGKMTVPVFAKIGAREYDIGTIEIDIEVTPSGKVKAPKPREFAMALKKARVR